MAPDPGERYRSGREALTALLRGRSDGDWARPVPACPGWDVRAAVVHLLGVLEDASSGRLTGPPDEQQVAAQLARHAGSSPEAVLDEWTAAGPGFEALVSQAGIWPVVFDVMAHTQDVRGALGEPGGRDDETIEMAARMMPASDLGCTLEFDLGTDVVALGATGPTHRVATNAFEVTRIRLGRRSPAQVAAMPWAPPLPAVPDGLFVFGPRETPLVE